MLKQGFHMRDVGSKRLDITVQIQPEQFVQYMEDTGRIFRFEAGQWDAATGVATLFLIPDNGFVAVEAEMPKDNS